MEMNNHNREISMLSMVRWAQWGTSKLPLIFTCMYYAALLRPEAGALSLMTHMAGLTLIFCLYASFGYVVNSYSDRACDTAALKYNALAVMSERRAGAGVYMTLITGLLSALFIYPDRPDVVALIGFSFLVAGCYSLPPLRFKERGLLGLIASAAAQRALPAVIVFQAMSAWDGAAIAMCALSMVIGIRAIIMHQISDIDADRAGGVSTMATRMGAPFMHTLVARVVLPFEAAALVASSLLMMPVAPVAGLAVMLYFIGFGLRSLVKEPAGQRDNLFPADPYDLDLYNFYWPTLLSILLITADNAYWPVAVFNAFWLFHAFHKLFRAVIKKTRWRYRSFKKECRRWGRRAFKLVRKFYVAGRSLVSSRP